MARRMSNSLTMVSTVSSNSGSGLDTMVGMPASLAYWKMPRTSSRLRIVITPPPNNWSPAAATLSRTAWRSSWLLVSGRCMSLRQIFFNPKSRVMSKAWSSLNLRSKYDATPIFSPRYGSAGGSASNRDERWAVVAAA